MQHIECELIIPVTGSHTCDVQPRSEPAPPITAAWFNFGASGCGNILVSMDDESLVLARTSVVRLFTYPCAVQRFYNHFLMVRESSKCQSLSLRTMHIGCLQMDHDLDFKDFATANPRPKDGFRPPMYPGRCARGHQRYLVDHPNRDYSYGKIECHRCQC